MVVFCYFTYYLYSMCTKNELIERFYSLYKKFGFKSVTVDDLAHEMAISKKTLYKEFKNRDKIVEEVIIFFLNELKKTISNIALEDINSLEKLVKIYIGLIEYLLTINPVFFYSLKRHYKNIFPLFENFRDGFLYPTLNELFSQGIKEKTFRKDTDIEYFLLAQDALISSFLNEEFSCNNSSTIEPNRFKKLILCNIRGMTTMQGFNIISYMMLPFEDKA